MFGPYVAVAMASTFSWGRYLQSTSKNGYNAWVDSGRKPPLHKDFADYIQWVVDEASPRIIKERVSSLSRHSGKWRVTGTRRNGKQYLHSTLFDAVVATGPGPAMRLRTVVAKGVPPEGCHARSQKGKQHRQNSRNRSDPKIGHRQTGRSHNYRYTAKKTGWRKTGGHSLIPSGAATHRIRPLGRIFFACATPVAIRRCSDVLR
jgi:hypothetical protein